jgi:hypothetical protein
VGSRVAADRIDRNHADSWADQMTEVAEKDPQSLILMIADMVRSSPPMVSSFVAEFARRLQGQSPALALPLTWIEQQLAESGLTIEQLVQSENQQQAADQVSISNTIGSLRFLGAMDWREFVETMSVVERTLREDPAGVYGKMDFATRDRYRHVVENIAKSSLLTEGEIARQAIDLAQQRVASGDAENRAAHVGYYLIDKGLPQLGRAARVRPSIARTVHEMTGRFSLSLYLGAILLITVVFTVALVEKAHAGGLHGWPLALTGMVALLCAGQLAVVLVNWLATLLATPHALPRMDLSAGIPPELRTLTVVPAMLTGAREVEDLVEALEVRFLANRVANLHFGLLTDFQDGREETLPEDAPLLQLARTRIEELNEKYRGARNGAFFLFHRPRCWNAQEGLWMGYERKRGKLAALNSLLRGATGSDFSLIVGETAVLPGVKYVITLDTDTQLPRDSAWQFVGAMAHPLNRPRFDENKQRVTEGYGILQPRVAVSLPGTNRSRYARLWGSEPGIDPYTRAVSDVYQDLFGEGSFIGKGIYDVDAFERSLKGRFPENRILSHDLLEGCYARAGLLSDVQLYEEYPSRYSADVSRRRRWIRGDWQIARWLLPRVPGLSGPRKNTLSGLSRWKIFDNLRRSLTPFAMILLLLLGWTVLSPAWLWTLAVIAILLIPPLLGSILSLFQKPDDVLLRQHLSAWAHSTKRHCAQAIFTFVCLPYEALYSLDALVRTAGRMLFTHRRLLEWNPSGGPGRDDGSDLFASTQSMWSGPAIVIIAVTGLTLSRPASLAVAGPAFILWFASPAIAWWISLPLSRRRARLTAVQTTFLRNLSRKTWAFFETFVSAEDNWLPPDNFQENPAGIIAHRTSPTNMGLALLANLSAWDFGYVSTAQLVERTANALQTMKGLERFRGHFYNWYDTRSLQPLPPLYVSTVDSGNLAGHLLTLRAGLLALPDQKILGPRWFDGLADTLKQLQETAAGARLAQSLRSACVSSGWRHLSKGRRVNWIRSHKAKPSGGPTRSSVNARARSMN